MSDFSVFVSFASKDIDMARKVEEDLSKRGFDAFIYTENVDVGSWRRTIAKKITTCRAFVILLSRDSSKSENVHQEIDVAQNLNLTPIPFWLEPLEDADELQTRFKSYNGVVLAGSSLPEALDRLCTVARSEGWTGLESVLTTAVSAAGERLEDSNIPVSSCQTVILDEVLSTDEPLATLEKRLFVEVLERCCWRMQEAADRLGMSRVTLWRKLKDHGIERPGNGDD